MAYQHCMLREGGQPLGVGSQSNAFCSHTDLEPIDCRCGEEESDFSWVWCSREEGGQAGSVVLGPEQRQITFNPEYSSGTAAVRGRDPLVPNLHHYWELKMTSAVYGTDIMVGVCTAKCDLNHGVRRFCSLLGRDAESWGYSYTGSVHHGGKFWQYGPRWGKGSIVGILLDGLRGTLSFFLNRKPLGLAFSGLQNKELYPIVSSTSAHSGMKLVTSCTVPANLQFLASAAIFLHLRQATKVPPADLPLPPGLRTFVENNFWPFLRSLGQRKKNEKESDVGWFGRGTKRPHSLEDVSEVLTKIKRLRRRLHLVDNSTVTTFDDTSQTEESTESSSLLLPSTSLSQVSGSSLFFHDSSRLTLSLDTNPLVPSARTLFPVRVPSSGLPSLTFSTVVSPAVSSVASVVTSLASPVVSSEASVVSPAVSSVASSVVSTVASEASPVVSSVASRVSLADSTLASASPGTTSVACPVFSTVKSVESTAVSAVASFTDTTVASPLPSTVASVDSGVALSDSISVFPVALSSSISVFPVASCSTAGISTGSSPTDQTK